MYTRLAYYFTDGLRVAMPSHCACFVHANLHYIEVYNYNVNNVMEVQNVSAFWSSVQYRETI